MHPTPPPDNTCNSCGRLMPSHAQHCPHCGAELSAGNLDASDLPASAPDVPSENQPVPAPAPYYQATGPSLSISPAAASPAVPLPPQPLLTSPPLAASPLQPARFDNASFWPRVIAYLIDSCVLGIFFCLYVTGIALLGSALSATSLAETADALSGMLFVIGVPVLIAVRVFYFAFMHGAFGATIGKAVLGLRVVYTDGSPITYGAAFWRILTRLVLYSFTGYLFYLSVPISAEFRGWHDYIAGTRVIHTDSPPDATLSA